MFGGCKHYQCSMADAYEPKTEEGKKMLSDGADLAVIQQMEEEGAGAGDGEGKDPEHVETPEEIAAREKAEGDANEAKGLNRDGSPKSPGEGGDKGEGEGGDEPPEREPKHMPMWKHKEELKKVRDELTTDFEKKLADAVSKKGGPTDDDVSKIAEEFNLEPEIAGKMIDRMAGVLEQRLGLGDLKKSAEQITEQAKAQAEAKGFDEEWGAKATQEALKAAAGDRQVTDSVKQRVHELAYSTEYARYRLSDVIRLNADSLFEAPSKQHKTAEAGRGGSNRGTPQKPISEMSSEEIGDLSDDEFMRLSEELGKSGSRYNGITRAKKK